jgi:hypothetical protein
MLACGLQHTFSPYMGPRGYAGTAGPVVAAAAAASSHHTYSLLTGMLGRKNQSNANQRFDARSFFFLLKQKGRKKRKEKSKTGARQSICARSGGLWTSVNPRRQSPHPELCVCRAAVSHLGGHC